MGLIDRLAEKVFDEATSVRRDDTQRRRALRDDAVAELRAYSEGVERMRVALLQARDSITSPAPSEPLVDRDDLIAPARRDEHLGSEIMRQALELGVNTYDASVIAANFAERAWINVFGPEALDIIVAVMMVGLREGSVSRGSVPTS